MFIKPNTNFAFIGTTNDGTGAASDASTLPIATLTRNGVDDATVIIIVTKLTTGRYVATGTVPVGYAAGDKCNISFFATVNAVAGNASIGDFVVDTAFTSDIAASLVTLLTNLAAVPAAVVAFLFASVRWQRQEAVTVGAYTKSGNIFTFTKQDGTSLLVTLDSSTAPTVRTPGS